jgi:hypothetical protein
MKYTFKAYCEGPQKSNMYLKLLVSRSLTKKGYYMGNRDRDILAQGMPDTLYNLLLRINDIEGINPVDLEDSGSRNTILQVEANMISARLSVFDTEDIRRVADKVANTIADYFNDNVCLLHDYDTVRAEVLKMNEETWGDA